MRNDKLTTPTGPAEHQLTSQEREVAKRLLQRLERDPLIPRFKVAYSDASEPTAMSIRPDHPMAEVAWGTLADALGTGDATFADALLIQLANVARIGQKLTDRELNGILSMVRGIGPRDPTEAMLAAQMAAIHNATMDAARRLNHAENLPQQDSASNMLNKLARTFAAQIEALKKYRSTGEQSVRVTHQHVNVSANQAVVGISQGGGGAHGNESQSHAPSVSSQSGPALLGHQQAQPLPLQSPGREGPTRLPDARREGGSTERKSQRRVAARAGDERGDRPAPGVIEPDA